MPKISPQNKLYPRGGPVNQHKNESHMTLTEEQKKDISYCRGIKQKHPCKNPVFRCGNCGNYGCDQPVLDKCSQQGFVHDKCLRCGETGTKELILQSDYQNLPDKKE